MEKFVIEPIQMTDRIDGSLLPLPEGVHYLSKESQLILFKQRIRQDTLASRFKRGS
jgi:hypothetical protein